MQRPNTPQLNSCLVGDWVFIKRNYTRKGESRKLSPLYDNLSEVIEINMPLLHIKNLSNGKTQWRHHNQLKLCKVRLAPDRSTRDLRVKFKTGNHQERDTEPAVQNENYRRSNRRLSAQRTEQLLGNDISLDESVAESSISSNCEN